MNNLRALNTAAWFDSHPGHHEVLFRTGRAPGILLRPYPACAFRSARHGRLEMSSSRPGHSIHATDLSRVNSLFAVKDAAWLRVKPGPGKRVAYLLAVSPSKKIMA